MRGCVCTTCSAAHRGQDYGRLTACKSCCELGVQHLDGGQRESSFKGVFASSTKRKRISKNRGCDFYVFMTR